MSMKLTNHTISSSNKIVVHPRPSPARK